MNGRRYSRQRLAKGSRSVNVIFRQGKRVADEGDFRILAIGGEHFDNVEAEADVGKVEQTQPSHGPLGHAALFVVIDGVGGASAQLGGASFHLDENQRVFRFVAADEVDFAAAGRDEIAIENAVAVAAQIALGLTFAPLTENDVVR